MQEFWIELDPPGLGRAATKTAKVAIAKRASLENMVKMSDWFGDNELDKIKLRVFNWGILH